MRLTWHTGRWPPSTSALFLKVRDLDITFIVLANTDNLTVPFPGIGHGDLSKSLPALTFLHHFGYPEVNGVAALRERIAALHPRADARQVLVTVGAADVVDVPVGVDERVDGPVRPGPERLRDRRGDADCTNRR